MEDSFHMAVGERVLRASSKKVDQAAGKRITTISRFRDIDILTRVLDELLTNPPLVLK